MAPSAWPPDDLAPARRMPSGPYAAAGASPACLCTVAVVHSDPGFVSGRNRPKAVPGSFARDLPSPRDAGKLQPGPTPNPRSHRAGSVPTEAAVNHHSQTDHFPRAQAGCRPPSGRIPPRQRQSLESDPRTSGSTSARREIVAARGPLAHQTPPPDLQNLSSRSGLKSTCSLTALPRPGSALRQ